LRPNASSSYGGSQAAALDATLAATEWFAEFLTASEGLLATGWVVRRAPLLDFVVPALTPSRKLAFDMASVTSAAPTTCAATRADD
jgi:hypothetical protein